jgi:hypothetical protein
VAVVEDGLPADVDYLSALEQVALVVSVSAQAAASRLRGEPFQLVVVSRWIAWSLRFSQRQD